ncbi:hypothetical protein HY635_03120 [Candidatus Uhrbacteria bacterium]|nr:hypothetical protein [Candidatus Uhrbacteria bacterium]
MQLPFSKQLITAALIVVLAPAATVIGAQSFSEFISQPQPYVAAQDMMGPPPGGQSGMPSGGEVFAPPPGGQPGQAPGGQIGSQPGGGETFGPPPGGQPGQAPGFAGPQGPPPGGQIGSQPVGGETFGPPPGGQPGQKPDSQPGSQQNGFGPPPGGQPGQTPGFGGPTQPPPTNASPQGERTCPNPPPNMKCEETGKYPNGCAKFKCERQEAPRHERSGPPPALENCAREVLGSEAFEQMLKGGQPTEEQKKLVGEKCSQFKREMPKPAGDFPGRGAFPGQPPGGEFPGRGEGLDRAPGAGGFGPDGSGQQTCNVQGVEMPGPCSRYEGRGPGGPGGEGMMGPGGFGPSEEDMERMEKEQKARMLKEMQRGLRGMEQGIRMMERELKACTQAKVDAGDAQANLAKIKEIVAKVKAVTDPEELQEIMSELPDLFDGARETIEMCHRLREIPRILKDLNRGINMLTREHRQLTAQVKRAKLDLADDLNEIAAGIATMKAIAAEVSRVKTTDEFEEAMAKLEGLHETGEDLRGKVEAIRGVLNVKRALADTRREIRNAERLVTSLKRKKVDVSELQQHIADGKTLVAEIEALAKQKPIDADALHEKFEMLMDLGQRAEETMAQLRGQKIERGPQFGRSAVEGVELPDSFRQFKKEEPEGPSEIESLLGF